MNNCFKIIVEIQLETTRPLDPEKSNLSEQFSQVYQYFWVKNILLGKIFFGQTKYLGRQIFDKEILKKKIGEIKFS